MSEEEKYVTVRIPKVFDDLINKYIEEHKEEGHNDKGGSSRSNPQAHHFRQGSSR